MRKAKRREEPGHAFVGDAGVGERRHLVVSGDGSAENRHRESGAGSLAQAETEIEERLDAEEVEERSMAGLRREMREERVVLHPGLELRGDGESRGGDEPIDDDRESLRGRRK